MGFRKKKGPKKLTPEEQAELEQRKKDYYKMDEEDYYDSNGNQILNKILPDGTIDKKDKKDKIFDNAFNSGEAGYRKLPDIKAEDDYADRRLNHVYEPKDYDMKLKLDMMCSDAFNESQWSGLPLNKKFSKDLMPYIFQDLFKVLDVDGHSVIDCFIAIAEFMDVSYEKVYWAAGLEVKARLIAECNAKFGSLDRKDIDRLF